MFRLNFTNVEEAPVKDFGMKVPNAEKYGFRCYDNPDVIVALITTIFLLYIIQLWW